MNDDILSRIAGRLTGITKEDLTTAESQIAGELIQAGYLVFDDTDVLKPSRPNGLPILCERANTLLVNDGGDMVAWLTLDGDTRVEVAWNPDNYPALNVTFKTLTDDQLVEHINTNLKGWSVRKGNLDGLKIDGHSEIGDPEMQVPEPSGQMQAFLTYCQDSGEPMTLKTAKSSLQKMPDDVLVKIMGVGTVEENVPDLVLAEELDDLILDYGENADFTNWLENE